MLTASTVANARPRDTAYRLSDQHGLYLIVRPNGSKWWRFDYSRPLSRERNTLSLGTWPAVSLKAARERQGEFRVMLADGIDPGAARRARARAEPETFAALAREWMATTGSKRTAGTNATIQGRVEQNLIPWLGERPIAAITAPELLGVLRRVEARGSYIVARRLLQISSAVFRYAIATGRAERDPASDLRGALKVAPPQKNHAALTEPSKVGELLRAIDGYGGSFIVRSALQLAPLVFVRPGELRAAEWPEFDLRAAEWRIPAERMKTGTAHIVPLSTQAVAILQDLFPLTGGGIPGKPDAPRYVFPGLRTRLRPMSENTVNAALRRLGFTADEMTAHGFRAMARSILAELSWQPDVIERQLAHKPSGPLRGAYDRAQYLEQRRKMMQCWSDHLDVLRVGPANVTPIRGPAG